ncbi:MAG: hypothetical protein PHV62_03210 [Sulfuricurvum sp.]|nr:hypothetical protein [Sulfuricurvum sp.]
MAMDWKNWATAGGAGMLGAGLGAMFGDYKNPADAAMGDMDKIPGQIDKYLQPYINQGNEQYGKLNDQYGQLMNDPGGRLNQIGQGYHQSPGFQFALQQALQGAGHAAAAGGMAGSPQHEQQNMGIATGLADQDYNQWLGNALGMYKTGLEGGQNIYNTGARAGMSAGEDMASYFANRAKLNYEGQNAENQHEGGMWGNLIGAGATAAAFFSSAKLKDYDSTPSTKEILDNVRELSLDRWKYKGIDQKFLGAYAEEFTDRFGVGDGKTINMVDAIGVLLGAIKELDKKIAILEGK